MSSSCLPLRKGLMMPPGVYAIISHRARTGYHGDWISTCTVTTERGELEGGNDEVRKRAVMTRKQENYSFTLMYHPRIVLVQWRGAGMRGNERGEVRGRRENSLEQINTTKRGERRSNRPKI